MGTLRGDNGGERPQEDGGLPGLPPEWGTIIIPDDAGELDREGAHLRRRFRREAFRRRWRQRFHLRPKPMGRATDESPGLAVPLLIMTVAVIATLTSLFAVAWPDRRPTSSPNLPIRTSSTRVSVSALTLVDNAGSPVRMGSMSPAVVLLVDGCACDDLIKASYVAIAASGPTGTTVAGAAGTPGPHPTGPANSGPSAASTPSGGTDGSAPSGTGGSTQTTQGPVVPGTDTVSLLVIAATLPALPGLPSAGSNRVRVGAYADPNHSLRAAVTGIPISPDGPALVLVDRDGTVQRVIAHVTSITEFQSDLDHL
jgi:hypothetical protein